MKKILFVFVVLVSVLSSCSSSDDDKGIELMSKDVVLSFEEEYKIDAKSESKILYTSENKYHASVSENGTITGGRVGETNILLNNGEDTKKIKVTIEAKSNLYPEPNLEFGISRADLIKKLGKPDNNSDDGIAYTSFSANAPIAAYFFDENDRLSSVAVMVKTSQSSNLGKFLVERYVPFSSENGLALFMNALVVKDVTMLVGAKVFNLSYWQVLYTTPTNLDSRMSSSISVDDELNSLLKF